MSTFLQTSGGDLDFSSHNLTLVTTLGQIVAQKLTNRLNFWLGTWYQDVRQGMPYLQIVFGVKAPSLQLVQQLFIQAILQTDGVQSINDCTIQFLSTTRRLYVKVEILCQDGSLLTASAGEGSPFIVILAGSGQT